MIIDYGNVMVILIPFTNRKWEPWRNDPTRHPDPGTFWLYCFFFWLVLQSLETGVVAWPSCPVLQLGGWGMKSSWLYLLWRLIDVEMHVWSSVCLLVLRRIFHFLVQRHPQVIRTLSFVHLWHQPHDHDRPQSRTWTQGTPRPSGTWWCWGLPQSKGTQRLLRPNLVGNLCLFHTTLTQTWRLRFM